MMRLPRFTGRGAIVALAAGVAVTAAVRQEPSAAETGRPFRLPLAGAPGPSTWYVSQAFGNTVFAFYERNNLYRSGQGLHMGIDFAAPCGTPVLAIGDGVVTSVDGRGGSPPHNLMIGHANGLTSFYGHLLERPHVQPGQSVAAGDVVAYTGDMLATCYSSPHLHLEIRDASLNRLQNPALWIDADWHRILQLGLKGPTFERDLLDPGRWQSFEDQPDIVLGGPLLNDYPHAWPAD